MINLPRVDVDVNDQNFTPTNGNASISHHNSTLNTCYADETDIYSLDEATSVPTVPVAAGQETHGQEPAERNTITQQLATIPTDGLQKFALDHIGDLAEMSRKDLAEFCSELKRLGVTGEWIRTELRPAVSDERRNNDTGVTWTHYVQAAQELGYKFRLNDLNDKLEINGRLMTDVSEAEVLSYLHARGLRNTDVARRAFVTTAAQNRHHPVKSYLESLRWDGRDHIAHLCEFLTDAHDPIAYEDGSTRSVSHTWLRRWFVGATGKVYNASDNQNPTVILDGAQGKGKSSLVKYVASPLPHLHREGPIRPEDKDHYGYLCTTWVWEISELGATFRRADREALKSFLTMQEVAYRPAFARYDVHKPALCSFIGTVNVSAGLLNDPTGHRRFRPVELTKIDWAYRQKVDINQVWAQAYHLYRMGETWQLSPEELKVHKAICELYEEENLIEGYIRRWFSINRDNDEMYTHTTEIIDTLKTCANLREGERALTMRVAETLKTLGLKKVKRNNAWGYTGIKHN